MNWTLKPQLRISLSILILFCLFFGLTQNALAQGIDYGNEVTAGETVENDIVLTGETITLDGTVVGDVLAIGSTVQVNGTVEGSLIIIGRFLTIDGEVVGTTYVIGRELTLEEAASLKRNLYFLGLTLDTLNESQIGRDLVALTLGANLEGVVGRDVRMISGAVQIIKLITDMIGKEVTGSPVNTPIAMTRGTSTQAQADYASVLPLTQFMAAINPQSGGIDTQRLGTWAVERLHELVTLFVFGLLAIWLLPRQLNRSVDAFRAKWLRSLGIGLLAIVIAFNIIGVAILIATLIIAIGYGLGMITLWDLAWAVWSVGLAALGLVFAIFWLSVVYGTKVIVAYVGGRMILDRLAPKATRYKVVPLLLGLVLYVILHGIPILGWVVAILSTAIGLGISWLVWRNKDISPSEMVSD
jgi:hypothetical protein